MEIITIQNLVKLAKNGYFPLFKSEEIRESLKKLRTYTPDNEKKIKSIIKEMKILKSYERKKLFIQSLNQNDKNIFIQHLFEKAHRLDEVKRIKYN